MKTLRSVVAIMVAALLISGCMPVMFDASGYDKSASMTSSEKKFTIVKHFTREVKCWYTLVNMIPVTEPNIAMILTEETTSARGDAVLNVRITGETTLIDALVPVALGVFGSIVSPPRGAFAGLLVGVRTYTIEGDVIQYRE